MSQQDNFETVEHTRRTSRKKREAALLLPVLGIFLLATPVVNAFTVTEGDASLYRMLSYVFGVWAALILTARLLASHLKSEVPDK